MTKPYIGVTGFKTQGEVRVANAIYRNSGIWDTEYVPMYGFITSDNRLKDRTIGGDTSPALEQLPALLRESSKGALTMIHHYTKNKEDLVYEVVSIFNTGGIYANGLCRALQLNATWPDVDSIKEIKKVLPEMNVVVSLTEKALADPELVQKARQYEKLATYMLIDPSGGKGKELDVKKGYDLIHKLHEVMPLMDFGLAGGFDGNNIGTATKQVEWFDPQVSFDAQGRLRNDIGIDYCKLKTYVNNAVSGLKSRR